MVEHPEAFYASLKFDIERQVNMARKLGLTPAVRLNGTSGLPKLSSHFADIFFPDVQFYDYPKIQKPWFRTRVRATM